MPTNDPMEKDDAKEETIVTEEIVKEVKPVEKFTREEVKAD